MRRLFAHLFLFVFLLSIVLRPFHFVWVQHEYHKHYSLSSIVNTHKDCPLEKVWSVEGLLKVSNEPIIISVSFFDYAESFYEPANTVYFDYNKLRAPPFA